MTEEDAVFDPTLKKKKKKKKSPFDGGMGEEDVVATTEEQPTEAPNEDDINLDLDDFSSMKKKKKKKKMLSLDELEGALPTDENKPPVGGDDDADLDFNLPQKKKKKKKIVFDPALGPTEGEGAEEDDDDAKDEPDSRSSGGTPYGSSVSGSAWTGSDRDYTYDELLQRVFNIMREKNPDIVAGEKRKFVMKPPQVLRVGTKKTSFANFLEICKMLHRQPQHLQSFLLAELGTSGSVDANNQLIIKGKFQEKQIENVLRRYIKEYVTCHTCRSPDTILQKDTRLFFLQCEKCGSRCSVASIKSGFQAVTGKRAAIRAKTA